MPRDSKTWISIVVAVVALVLGALGTFGAIAKSDGKKEGALERHEKVLDAKAAEDRDRDVRLGKVETRLEAVEKSLDANTGELGKLGSELREFILTEQKERK